MGNLVIKCSHKKEEPKKEGCFVNKKEAPKHMLWGCRTVEEHYQYIEEACKKSKHKYGHEGLALLGFEYRMYHNPETCTCSNMTCLDNDDLSEDGDPDLVGKDDDDNDDDNDDEYDSESDHHPPDIYMAPISGATSSTNSSSTSSPENQHPTNDTANHKNNILCYKRSDSALDLLAQRYEILESEKTSSLKRQLSRINSSASMFSLATHHTYTSSANNTMATRNTATHDAMMEDYSLFIQTVKPGPNPPKLSCTNNKDTTYCCSLRLFHIPSQVYITSTNFQSYIAHGTMYDEVARLCMEYAQEIMIQEGDLQWYTIQQQEKENDTIRALVSRHWNPTQTTTKKPTLVIITGTGDVRAGIFSRRHLMIDGIEVSTALPFIRDCQEKNINVVLLDPNARGSRYGMNTLEQSLETLFFNNNHNNTTTKDGFLHTQEEEKKEPNEETNEEKLFLLAHSMAGSQIVRFINNKITLEGNNTQPTGIQQFLKKLKAIAFTDSNHNIKWVTNNKSSSLSSPTTTNNKSQHLLQQDFVDLLVNKQKSIYIKSHRVHEDTKILGELHHDCNFWKNRFGTIHTIWAGTKEHALTNYMGRYYIWDLFDAYLPTEQPIKTTSSNTNTNNNDTTDVEDEDDNLAPSF